MAKSKRNATTFKAGDPTIPKPAGNNQVRYREEFTQILISQLNEIDTATGKAKKYLLIERLVALGIGLDIVVKNNKGKIVQSFRAGGPNLAAIKEIFDRLIGKPQQQITVDPDEKTGSFVLILNQPGDDTD